MKIIILAILLSAFVISDSPIVHYDDEDGHREPWAEWVESSCISDPWVTIDSATITPERPCNPTTNLGVTVWMCFDGSDRGHPYSFYTAHWYCDEGVIGEALSLHQIYLPLINKE